MCGPEEVLRRIVTISRGMFSVLEGEIEVTFRGRSVAVRAGETVNIPANAPHAFLNVSDRPARMLCVCSPAGQEDYFRRIGVAVAGRTDAPSKLGPRQQADLAEKAEELASTFKTEILKDRLR